MLSQCQIKSAIIVTELTKVFLLWVYHKFYTLIKVQILKAPLQSKLFEPMVSHSQELAKAYHPQRDGMVERFNQSLLQLLRTYMQKEAD